MVTLTAGAGDPGGGLRADETTVALNPRHVSATNLHWTPPVGADVGFAVPATAADHPSAKCRQVIRIHHSAMAAINRTQAQGEPGDPPPCPGYRDPSNASDCS